MFNNTLGINNAIKFIAGTFSIADTGGVATKGVGMGWTVENTDTGEYTITYQDTYTICIAATATVQAAIPVDLNAQILSKDAQTLVINLLEADTPTEPSAVTEVNFIALLQDSTVGQ